MSRQPDDGFKEIQLNGKQLVFLFMAATVVSVVIFLCGVLVGRGVRDHRAAAADGEGMDLSSAASLGGEVVEPAADPTKADPPPAIGNLSYFDRLEQAGAPAEVLKPVAPDANGGQQQAKAESRPAARKEAAAPARNASERQRDTERLRRAEAARTNRAAAAPADEAPKERGAAQQAATAKGRDASQQAAGAGGAGTVPTSGEVKAAAGGPFEVQVAALNARRDADAVASRLTAKGYTAYVLTSPENPSVYRVRIGPFKTRRDAESMKARLEREERLKPWIPR